jgi:flavin reductase (DIM6/NTAB) family NADH-FMN oxidoreductase RutF
MTLESGAPVLKEAVMSLDCELVQVIDSGTHALLVGKVLAGRRAPEHAPLIYVDGSWATVDMGLMAA